MHVNISSDNTVDIKVRYINKQIEVTFIDKGIGISEEDIHKIFEPFHRGANAMSIPGSGIGLSLVNQIIGNHNGTIEISSGIDKGTIAVVCLPVIPVI